MAARTVSTGTWVLAATVLGSSLVFIDGSVVSIALPIVQTAFHASSFEAQWVVEAYTLVLGALMLLCGALGDRYGRKLIFVGGVIVFAGGSILCGMAQSMPALIAFRVLQGIGGTMLAPASLALIGSCFEGEARGKAVGTWSGMTAMASAIGPVAGGVIVDHLGWRWIFFINVPIAAAVIVLALLHIPESRDREVQGPLDLLGSLFVTAGLGAIVYAFVASGIDGWRAPSIAALVLGCAAIAAFILTEARIVNPILPLGLFARRAFAGVNVMTFFLYGALGGMFYFLPFVMIQVDRYDATVTGIAMLPFIALIVVLSRFSGGLAYRVGARTLLVAGPSITAIGFVGFAFLPHLNYWSGILPSVLFVGLGMGLTVAPLTATMIESVPPDHVGLASGINNAMSRVAGLLAIAIFGALLSAVFASRLTQRMQTQGFSTTQRAQVEAQRLAMAGARFDDPHETAVVDAAYLDGFRSVALACALSAAFSAIVSAATIAGRDRTARPSA